MTAQRKFLAPEIVHGAEARLRVGQAAQILGIEHALLVGDPGLRDAGWYDEVRMLLEHAGIAVTTFIDVTPNPKHYEVAAGYAVYQSAMCNGLVAVGGGSVIDCAKGIGILASNGGDIRDYAGIDTVCLPCPPLVCIPTTAGSSADVSQFAIINDADRRVKIAIVCKALVPDVALVDYETTATMGPELCGHTAMDALTHAIEAMVSTAASPLTDVHAEAAIRLLARYVPERMRDPQSIAAQDGIMLASLHAGLAFSNASLGAVHAMSHALGGLMDLPHGLCNATLLPQVVGFNYQYAADAYARVARALGLEEEGPAALTAALEQLQTQADPHMQQRLGNIEPGMLSMLVEAALADACMVTNPRPATADEIRRLYEQLAHP